MFTIPLRLAGRVMIAAVLALAGAATPALAAPIGDGTSNTIIFGELAGRPDSYVAGRKVPGRDEVLGGPWAAYENGLIVKGFSRDGTKSPGRCAINCNNQDVYSFHPGGANILFADGHVRFMSATIDIREFVKMVTRAGGEVILEP